MHKIRTSSQLLAGLFLAGFLVPSLCVAQSRVASEPELKAAFVFNFARFVEWPDSAFAADGRWFRICVAGSMPMADLLDQVTADKTLAGRKIHIREVKNGDLKLRECQILLVESGSPLPFLEAIRDAAVLTVGNGTPFIQNGGIIDFTKEQDTIHFEINPELAQRSQLKISSKLLALARIVRMSPQP
jgi:hypothetical protein